MYHGKKNVVPVARLALKIMGKQNNQSNVFNAKTVAKLLSGKNHMLKNTKNSIGLNYGSLKAIVFVN